MNNTGTSSIKNKMTNGTDLNGINPLSLPIIDNVLKAIDRNIIRYQCSNIVTARQAPKYEATICRKR